jgi:hypothetical protein
MQVRPWRVVPGAGWYVHPCYTATKPVQVGPGRVKYRNVGDKCALTLFDIAIWLDTCSSSLHTPGIAGRTALDPFYQQVTLGVILLLAVGVDAWSRRFE